MIMTNKSILDDLLGIDVPFKPNEEEDKILLPLLDEINLINNFQIKMFTRAILLQAKIFWKIPSSFSGKHHPPDEHSSGGNVLHTKRVVKAAEIIVQSYSLNDIERDMVYSACLIHDITKGIDNVASVGEYLYDPMHPYTVGKFVTNCQENDKKYSSEASSSTLFLDEETVQSILRLVRCHLGPWSPIPETYPTSFLDMIVHLSDNIASKVHKILEVNPKVSE